MEGGRPLRGTGQSPRGQEQRAADPGGDDSVQRGERGPQLPRSLRRPRLHFDPGASGCKVSRTGDTITVDASELTPKRCARRPDAGDAVLRHLPGGDPGPYRLRGAEHAGGV